VSEQLTGADVRTLSLQLSAAVLEQVAPEELLVLDETAEEFWAAPDKLLDPRHRDEALGFGLDLALMAPYALAVCGPVVNFLADCVLQSVRSETQARTDTLVARLFRRVPGRTDDAHSADGTLHALTTDQVRTVHDVARAQATRCGLSADQAGLLADAVAGALAVADPQ
jgi:hypothetical protein